MIGNSDKIKLFAITNQLLEHALDQVEEDRVIDLGRGHQEVAGLDDSYYPQIEQELRDEAARMAPHYELFYSLEKTIRKVIRDSLVSAHGDSWWDDGHIPTTVKQQAEKKRQDEIDSGVTRRSDELLDFTTFGELSEIIKADWSVFGGMFSSVKAVEKVMSNLNTIRGPIAHFSPLSEDEILRLQLSMRDWFRLME